MDSLDKLRYFIACLHYKISEFLQNLGCAELVVEYLCMACFYYNLFGPRLENKNKLYHDEPF